MPMQVNITTKVNSQSIRRETYNGREHLVLPSYTLPANVVMNGGLYTEDEINAHYQGLEGTLAPLGHPQVNGQFVSAFLLKGLMPAISARGTATLRSPAIAFTSKSGLMWPAPASLKADRNCLNVSPLLSEVKMSRPFIPVWRRSSTNSNQMNSSAQLVPIGWQNPQYGP